MQSAYGARKAQLDSRHILVHLSPAHKAASKLPAVCHTIQGLGFFRVMWVPAPYQLLAAVLPHPPHLGSLGFSV